MKDFVKRMIDEHAQLAVRTQALHNWVYGDGGKQDEKVEFANKCIQLSAMKKYEEALRARLENQGIYFQNGKYFEKVANITPVVATGNDKPADSEEDNNNPADE